MHDSNNSDSVKMAKISNNFHWNEQMSEATTAVHRTDSEAEILPHHGKDSILITKTMQVEVETEYGEGPRSREY